MSQIVINVGKKQDKQIMKIIEGRVKSILRNDKGLAASVKDIATREVDRKLRAVAVDQIIALKVREAINSLNVQELVKREIATYGIQTLVKQAVDRHFELEVINKKAIEVLFADETKKKGRSSKPGLQRR